MTLQAILMTDGSSDTVLLPILRWVLASLTASPAEVRFADLRGIRNPPRGLNQRLTRAIDLYPCELLFVHRDAEGQDPNHRYKEICDAAAAICPHVAVVPIRMQEAWLLHDEIALRLAAGRPSGREPLDLPPKTKWEDLPNPKDVLHHALRVASGAKGRRAKRFNPGAAVHRLVELVDDWSHLRGLRAFDQLESDTSTAIYRLGLTLRSPRKDQSRA